MARSIDLQGHFRIQPNVRDLNYGVYFEKVNQR